MARELNPSLTEFWRGEGIRQAGHIVGSLAGGAERNPSLTATRFPINDQRNKRACEDFGNGPAVAFARDIALGGARSVRR